MKAKKIIIIIIIIITIHAIKDYFYIYDYAVVVTWYQKVKSFQAFF